MMLDGAELWRTVPPEEKVQMMSKAHAKGVMSALILIVTACTVAVGLQIQILIWASLLAAPIVFQVAAGKAWRDMRPRVMLEYLAVRSAARRYAFTLNAKDLGLIMIFRGTYEEIVTSDQPPEEMEASFLGNASLNVWVALFQETVVVLRENQGGAKMVFGHPLTTNLSITSSSPESGKDYANDREIRIDYRDKKGDTRAFKLTSKFPGALIVFEKKALGMIKEAVIPPVVAQAEMSDDPLDKMFDNQ